MLIRDTEFELWNSIHFYLLQVGIRGNLVRQGPPICTVNKCHQVNFWSNIICQFCAQNQDKMTSPIPVINSIDAFTVQATWTIRLFISNIIQIVVIRISINLIINVTIVQYQAAVQASLTTPFFIRLINKLDKDKPTNIKIEGSTALAKNGINNLAVQTHLQTFRFYKNGQHDRHCCDSLSYASVSSGFWLRNFLGLHHEDMNGPLT